jgi:hypothetical protein
MASKYVRCIAVYEDGSEHGFSVLEDHLRNGGHVLRILAGKLKGVVVCPLVN